MADLGVLAEQLGYRTLRDIYAERTKEIVFWVGAGLSAPAGIPMWKALRSRLETEIETRAKFLESEAQKRLERQLVGIRRITDPWLAFERIAGALGAASYEQVIRECLSARESVIPPSGYERVWTLRPVGVVTTNLDRLATRQFSRVSTASDLFEVAGTRLADAGYILKSGRPFVINLHGTIEERSTWILKKTEIDKLQNAKAYNAFINALFLTKTVVFLGLSVEDRGAGGLLGQLKKYGIDAGAHFWITNRRDASGDDWAASNGIQIIHYDAEPGEKEHSKLLDLLDSFASYLPREPDAKPVLAPVLPPAEALPSPDELEAKDSNTIRKVINAYAQRLLGEGGTDRAEKYNKFCDDYEIAIQRSYNVSERSPKNRFFDYEVIKRIGRGLFGEVYEAVDRNGLRVAIKVLHEHQRQKEDMRSAFRRGVRALQIVASKNIRGMVWIIEAFELPSSIVMEFVDGPTLWDAITSQQLQSWPDRIEVANQIANIVRKGHLLPERVLHRDIRPHNIILRDFYKNRRIDVCVLDFDLSWHKDAAERSIDAKALTQLAYAAPEQLERIPGVSARNAAVDSFGLGMTIFAIIAGDHPSVGAFKMSQWPKEVLSKFVNAAPSSLSWRSTPVRLARIVTRATSERQSERLDFSQIVSGLEQLIVAENSPFDVDDPEMWVDEIATRSFGATEYTWDADRRVASRNYLSGLSITIQPFDLPPHVQITISWSSAGEEDRRNIGKYIPERADQIAKTLRTGGWQDINVNRNSMSLAISGSMKVDEVRKRIASMRSVIENVAELVRFE